MKRFKFNKPLASGCLLFACLLLSAIPFTQSHALDFRAGTIGDSDNDGVEDAIDLDDDNDTITDEVEGTQDTDGDGIIDCLDRDSDNDGISDLVEAVTDVALLNVLDRNNDGKLDNEINVGTNGLADQAETSLDSGITLTGLNDADSDGIRDQQDLDSDNDGIPDVMEGGADDVDGNGLIDQFRDIDADGIDDQRAFFPIRTIDSDADGVLNFRDLDSDQDGVSDRLEASGIDVDSNGQVDNFQDADFNGLYDQYNADTPKPINSDGDVLPDYLDSDSDNDGVSDAQEAFDVAPGSTDGDPSTGDQTTNANHAAENGQSAESITLQTGESGNVFGCSINSGSQGSSLLLMMMLASLVLLFKKFSNKKLYPRLAKYAGLGSAFFLLSGCAIPTTNVQLAQPIMLEPYVGVGLGASFLNANTTGIALEQDNDIGSAAQLTLGLGIGSRFALETRYADLGEATFTDGRAVGYQVADISGIYRFGTGRINGFARLGGGALFNDGDIETEQKNPNHLVVGAGLNYQINDVLSLRGEWMGHDADISHGQLSVLYRFGRSVKRAPAVVVAKGNTPSGQSEEQIEVARQVPVAPDVTKPDVVVQAESPNLAAPKANPTPKLKPLQTSPEKTPSTKAVAPTAADVKPATVEPETAEPETAEPETAEPETAEPETAEPETAEPETAEPETTEPETTEPETAEPETTERETPEPETTERETPEPEPKTAEQPVAGDAEPATPSEQAGVEFDGLAEQVQFWPNTDQLTLSAENWLREAAKPLLADTSIKLVVATYTLDKGDEQASLFLSRRRALAIIRFLADKGVASSRLRPEAFGSSKPLSENAAAPKNERVELTKR